MKSGFEKIQEELELQPPALLSLEGTDVANGVLNGHTPVHAESGKGLLFSGAKGRMSGRIPPTRKWSGLVVACSISWNILEYGRTLFPHSCYKLL